MNTDVPVLHRGVHGPRIKSGMTVKVVAEALGSQMLLPSDRGGFAGIVA